MTEIYLPIRCAHAWPIIVPVPRYEDALILKTFLFQFVNAYFSLFYTAFVKSSPFVKDLLQLQGAHARTKYVGKSQSCMVSN